MEEGPEPQEWVERSVEHQHHHHAEHPAPEATRQTTMLYAITAAILAVFAAFGSLLSGHEANQAIIHQTQATDQWSYYQSKSTKGHVYEVGKEIVRALATAQGPAELAKIQQTLETFEQQVSKYESQKADSEKEARKKEQESQHEFQKHHYYALGIAAFQIGIVLASISILVRYRLLWFASLFAGLVGIGFLGRGMFLRIPEQTAERALNRLSSPAGQLLTVDSGAARHREGRTLPIQGDDCDWRPQDTARGAFATGSQSNPRGIPNGTSVGIMQAAPPEPARMPLQCNLLRTRMRSIIPTAYQS